MADVSKPRATRFVFPPPFITHPRAVASGAHPVDASAHEAMSREEMQDVVRYNASGVPMVAPLSLRLSSDAGSDWLLPYEPMITITGKHIVTKRQVAKGKTRGSVKERWALDDYQVKIEGILIGAGGEYPADDVSRLRSLCEAGEVIATSPLLELFGIARLVIESWEMPHTAGEANQNYALTCLSDDTYKLLLRPL